MAFTHNGPVSAPRGSLKWCINAGLGQSAHENLATRYVTIQWKASTWNVTIMTLAGKDTDPKVAGDGETAATTNGTPAATKLETHIFSPHAHQMVRSLSLAH